MLLNVLYSMPTQSFITAMANESVQATAGSLVVLRFVSMPFITDYLPATPDLTR